jgi:hypothetical protein
MIMVIFLLYFIFIVGFTDSSLLLGLHLRCVDYKICSTYVRNHKRIKGKP